jgi:hypothetical protein
MVAIGRYEVDYRSRGDKMADDWRVKRVFNPAIIESMKRHWGDSDEARTRAEAMADSFRATASP